MPYAASHALPMTARAVQARARRSPDGPALHSVMRLPILAPCLRLTLSSDPMRLTAPLRCRPRDVPGA